MRQFANYIFLAPSFRVSSVTSESVIMKSGFTQDRFLTHNEVEPSEESVRKPGGMLYNFQVKVFVDKLSEARKKIYGSNAPVIATLMDVESVDKLIVGTPESPAVISLVPGTNHDQLVIEWASKTPVL